jgi:hypothetical protein
MRWRMLIVAAALTSCGNIPQYPAVMPALAQAVPALDVCPAIAGVYADTGTAVTPDGRTLGSVSLTRLLHPDRSFAEKADVVVVKGPERDLVEIDALAGKTQLAIWRQSKVTREAYLAKGDRVAGEMYGCQEGFVRLGRQYNFGGGGAPPALGVFWWKADFLWLRKAVDGSLVILHTDYDYAAIEFIVPVGTADKVWYQFPPAPVDQ